MQDGRASRGPVFWDPALPSNVGVPDLSGYVRAVPDWHCFGIAIAGSASRMRRLEAPVGCRRARARRRVGVRGVGAGRPVVVDRRCRDRAVRHRAARSAATAATLSWAGGSERWERFGVATWAAGLIAMFVLDRARRRGRREAGAAARRRRPRWSRSRPRALAAVAFVVGAARRRPAVRARSRARVVRGCGRRGRDRAVRVLRSRRRLTRVAASR